MTIEARLRAERFISHVAEFEEENTLVHWYILGQCFLAQLDATVSPLCEREPIPFLTLALRNCHDCNAGRALSLGVPQ